MTRDVLVCEHAEANCLHPLECEPLGLPSTYEPTLTEVACAAIYGAPLKSGRGDGSVFQKYQSEEQILRRMWGSEDGVNLLHHVHATGASAIETAGDSQNLLAFVRQWHDERRRIVVEALPQRHRATAELLKTCADSEALRLASNAAVNRRAANARVVDEFRLLYRVASELITCKAIMLTGLPELASGEFLPAGNGGLHRELPAAEYRLGLGHDLVDNSIACHVPYDPNLWADSIFDREHRLPFPAAHHLRKPEYGFLTWRDIRIEHQMANALVGEYLRRSGSVRSATGARCAKKHATRRRRTESSRRQGRPSHPALERIKPQLMARLEYLGEPGLDIDPKEGWSSPTAVGRWVVAQARKVVASDESEPGSTTVKTFVRRCLSEYRLSKQR